MLGWVAIGRCHLLLCLAHGCCCRGNDGSTNDVCVRSTIQPVLPPPPHTHTPATPNVPTLTPTLLVPARSEPLQQQSHLMVRKFTYAELQKATEVCKRGGGEQASIMDVCHHLGRATCSLAAFLFSSS